ncbi:MAG: PilZ domain-containing protein [Spirochaetaceae bacterium]|jgi:hypothetical protein|nr:PilZ domain-containing protein [Spirochaetaceae bacterium]
MGTLTRQKIQEYYEQFKSIPVTFNKEIIKVTGLQAKQISIKCASDFFPCVVYSTSFEEAKVVANMKSGLVERLKDTNNAASIKFSFTIPATGEHVAFLVSVHAAGSAPYNGSEEMSIFTMQYSQRPPDDLIEIMGRILDASVTAAKRKDENIPITATGFRKLKFSTKEIGLTIQGVPRFCVLRDLSFSGARAVVVGVSKLLLDKTGTIKFEFSDPQETFEISGKILSATPSPERKEMVLLEMSYNEPVPMSYKIRLSEYLGTLRKVPQSATPVAAAATTVAQPEAAPAAEK